MRESTDWLYRDIQGVVHEVNDHRAQRACDDYRYGYGTMRDRKQKYPTCLWCAVAR